jgi:hypothetical protein
MRSSAHHTWSLSFGVLGISLAGCFFTPGEFMGDETTDAGDTTEAGDTSTRDTLETSTPTESSVTPTTNGGESSLYCTDADIDGFGDPTQCTAVPPGEDPPPGTVDNNDDCDDTDGFTFPGAAPNDDPVACMNDDDNDDWGDEDPDGPIKPGTDCDDADADNHDMCGPVCIDEDMDGYCADCGMMCPGPNPNEDCDDGDEHTFPGAAPLDDPDACMTDEDEDDHGDDTPSDPDALPGTDCDDNDGTAFPGAAPLDSPDACMKDGDDDDHGDGDPENPDVTPGNDCNDDHSGINPTDSQLITGAINTGEILEITLGTSEVTSIAQIDTTGFNPWIPSSIAINPENRDVVAALAFKSSLVTMNYCGAGTPTAMPEPHKKNLCAIGFDADGVLWGVDSQVDELIKFFPDGSVDSAVDLTIGGFGLDIAECGMTWDCHQSRMLLSDSGTDAIYEVNTDDATLITLASLPDENFGSGLAYEPVSKQVLSCFGQSFYSIAIDGTNTFTKRADIVTPNIDDIDDIEFAPNCNE